MSKRIAILGSNGMIGSHLKALLTYKNIDFIEVNRDIWDLSVWKEDSELDQIFENITTIFHFAAVLPKRYSNNIREIFDVNVRSSVNLSEWALKKGIEIVFLSSSSIYLEPNAKKIKEDAQKTIYGLGGFYGYSKLLSEQIFNYYEAQGLKLIILRPTSVYGKGLKEGNLISLFLNNLKNEKDIVLDESNNRVNFIHAIDVAYAALLAYNKSSYGTYNIASCNSVTILELAKACISAVGSGNIKITGENPNPFVRFDLDCTKAKEGFCFDPKISIKEGINAMYSGDMLESLFK